MIRDFFLAVGFFTRIPVPNHPNYTDAALQRSAVYFPLVGLCVGSILALVYGLAILIWSPPIAVIFTMTIGFLLTGGFHEDGWADTFDGLGGAFSVEKKLAIMTDSRLGTYGSLALWAMLSLKAVSLMELLPKYGAIVLILAHSLSRWTAMSAMVFSQYVRKEDNKSRPIVQQLSKGRWLAALLFVLPILFVVSWTVFALITLACLIVASLWILFLKRQIGGYTGDTLGALQQLAELTVLLVWLCF